MFILQSIGFWFLLTSLCIKFVTPSVPTGQYFVLKNPHSGYVLDASQEWVTLQQFTGFTTQHWRLEAATGGQFYIVNKFQGKVLDLDYRYPIKNSWVVVSNKIDDCKNECSPINMKTKASMNIGACQKWYVHYGGFIVNSCGKYAVEIRKDNYTAGVYLETWDLSEKDNQKFTFLYV
ncbi:uncharacterized protein LOC135123993 [Zophobas morio]|uniref:uncharacterized protein LOC135123993 n=1 Tax=Zophobas morio TaxID=2755281 RepID=UPI0030829D80